MADFVTKEIWQKHADMVNNSLAVLREIQSFHNDRYPYRDREEINRVCRINELKLVRLHPVLLPARIKELISDFKKTSLYKTASAFNNYPFFGAARSQFWAGGYDYVHVFYKISEFGYLKLK